MYKSPHLVLASCQAHPSGHRSDCLQVSTSSLIIRISQHFTFAATPIEASNSLQCPVDTSGCRRPLAATTAPHAGADCRRSRFLRRRRLPYQSQYPLCAWTPHSTHPRVPAQTMPFLSPRPTTSASSLTARHLLCPVLPRSYTA